MRNALNEIREARPDIFSDAEKLIARRIAEQANRLLLPEGRPREHAIPLNAPQGESSVRLVPAQKGPMAVDPKTGKFMKITSRESLTIK